MMSCLSSRSGNGNLNSAVGPSDPCIALSRGIFLEFFPHIIWFQFKKKKILLFAPAVQAPTNQRCMTVTGQTCKEPTPRTSSWHTRLQIMARGCWRGEVTMQCTALRSRALGTWSGSSGALHAHLWSCVAAQVTCAGARPIPLASFCLHGTALSSLQPTAMDAQTRGGARHAIIKVHDGDRPYA